MSQSISWALFRLACASSLLLACSSPNANTNSNQNNVNVNIGQVSISGDSNSVFKALGGAGLNPSVQKYCQNKEVSGDQGQARSVAKEYRGHLEKLSAMITGQINPNTGSVYGVDTPSPGPSTNPTPSATSDISIVERTSFNGDISDPNGLPLDGATVSVNSLNLSVPFTTSVSTVGGAYAVNDAPAGVQLEITLTQPGFAPRKRVVVLKSNKQGDPNANKYDFTDGIFGLSDQPEVIAVSPARNASGISKDTPFKLTFSEAMDKTSVEASFALQTGALGSPQTLAFGPDDFEASWNSEATEVSFMLKPDRILNSQTTYSMSFAAGDQIIKDQSGIGRTSDYFKLVINGGFEATSRFHVLQLLSQQYQPLPAATKARDSYYFSYDDSASVASVELAKHALQANQAPQKEWGKTWEFLNYESFDHQDQQSIGLFEASMGLWKYADLNNPYLDNYEVGVHLSAPYRCKATRKNINLTMLIDVSTSMSEPAGLASAEAGQSSKLDLIKFGLKEMATQLKAGDQLNLVLFSNKAFVELENFQVGQNPEADFLKAIEKIEPLGGTNFQQGIENAYQLASKHYQQSKLNRVMLMTDARPTEGAFDLEQVKQMAAQNNDKQIYLSALGLGHNHNNALLQAVTEAGRGAYYSINTKTDMKEAMGDRFIPLIDVIARNVRFKLEFPGWLRHGKSAAEEISRDPAQVQATNFSANTSQYFWEQFQANKPDYSSNEKVQLIITYTDPLTGTDKQEILQKSIAEIIDKDLSNIKAAHLVQLTTSLIRREIDPAEVRQELDQLLPDTGK